jgi:solute carrier family 25 phosphate transporter 23/24/25/41
MDLQLLDGSAAPAKRIKFMVVASTAHGMLLSSPTAQTFVAGGIAGAVSRTCTAPLDRIKLLAQEGRLQPRGNESCGGLARLSYIIAHVYRKGGCAAFWRGNGVNCLKAGPEHAAAFTCRQAYVNVLCEDPLKPTFIENCMVGSAAGCTAQAILYPVEVVKTRMAVADCHEYRGIADCFKQSLRLRGLAGLYVGMGANMCGIFPHRGLEMGIFFTLESRFKQQDDVATLRTSLGVGFVASTVAQTVTYPLNLCRTKLQTQGVNGRCAPYNGMVHCLVSVVKAEGFRGLFAGMAPNLLKAVPSSMLMYVTFRRVQHFFEQAAASAHS